MAYFIFFFSALVIFGVFYSFRQNFRQRILHDAWHQDGFETVLQATINTQAWDDDWRTKVLFLRKNTHEHLKYLLRKLAYRIFHDRLYDGLPVLNDRSLEDLGKMIGQLEEKKRGLRIFREQFSQYLAVAFGSGLREKIAGKLNGLTDEAQIQRAQKTLRLYERLLGNYRINATFNNFLLKKPTVV